MRHFQVKIQCSSLDPVSVAPPWSPGEAIRNRPPRCLGMGGAGGCHGLRHRFFCVPQTHGGLLDFYCPNTSQLFFGEKHGYQFINVSNQGDTTFFEPYLHVGMATKRCKLMFIHSSSKLRQSDINCGMPVSPSVSPHFWATLKTCLEHSRTRYPNMYRSLNEPNGPNISKLLIQSINNLDRDHRSKQ